MSLVPLSTDEVYGSLDTTGSFSENKKRFKEVGGNTAVNRKKICVVGLGYIGLPTAAMFATHGHEIIGVDTNENVVNALKEGRITISEPYLDIMVQAAVTSGNLRGEYCPKEADVFIISVPTPITAQRNADMSHVISAAESIVPYLKKGNVVVLESTSPVGTVRDLVCPILAESGLMVGRDIYVAHCPERVLPGQILIEMVNNNRIVGGVNYESAEIVRELYRTFVRGEIYITDSTTAEMCKMMENTYRDVNIALANELSMICEKAGISVWEVIELCNRHPRVNIHRPGPGVGGHCLAVDPWFIVRAFPETSKLIKLARQTNDSMPQHVFQIVNKILSGIEGEKTVTILGVTYKPDVDDIRESPMVNLIQLMKNSGNFNVKVVDNYVKNFSDVEKDPVKAAAGSCLLLLGVDHREFRNLDFKKISNVMYSRNVLDTRNFFDREELERLGFNYFLLGSPIDENHSV